MKEVMMQLYLESYKTLGKVFDLGMTLSQLGSVSAQTIFYRTAFMQQGAASSQWQQNEAQAMTSEKVDAAQAGGQALWKGWYEMNLSIIAVNQENIRRLNEISIPTSPLELLSTQTQIMKIGEECSLESLKLGNEAIDTLKKTIKPAHSYASDNANRLSNKKSR